MNPKAIALVLILVALPIVPTGAGQATLENVKVTGVRIEGTLIVNLTSTAHAYVETEGAAVVEVTFTYDSPEGPGIQDPDAPGGQGYKLTRSFAQATTTTFSLPFEPTYDRLGAQRIVATARVIGTPDRDASDDTAATDAFVGITGIAVSSTRT